MTVWTINGPAWKFDFMCPYDCGTRVRLNEEFDAYYCPSCVAWTESQCSPNCDACGPRPETPPLH